MTDFLVNSGLEAVNTFKHFWEADRITMDKPRALEGLEENSRATWRGNLFGHPTHKCLDYIFLDRRSSHRMGGTRIHQAWAFPSDHSALAMELRLAGQDLDWLWHEREQAHRKRPAATKGWQIHNEELYMNMLNRQFEGRAHALASEVSAALLAAARLTGGRRPPPARQQV